MIGLFLGEKDLPNEIIKKIEKKKIKYLIFFFSNFFKISNGRSFSPKNSPIILYQEAEKLVFSYQNL